jgi:hypothetical protein
VVLLEAREVLLLVVLPEVFQALRARWQVLRLLEQLLKVLPLAEANNT